MATSHVKTGALGFKSGRGNLYVVVFPHSSGHDRATLGSPPGLGHEIPKYRDFGDGKLCGVFYRTKKVGNYAKFNFYLRRREYIRCSFSIRSSISLKSFRYDRQDFTVL